MTTSMVMDMNLGENSGSKKTVNNGGGRRRSKASELTQKKNKPPQRGKGVAQLEDERLRLERWKKMTEIPSLQSLPIPSFNPSVTFQTSSSVSVPNGAFQFRQAHVPSHNLAVLFPTSGMHSQNPFCSDQFMDPSVIGLSNGGFRFENSKELTSIPNYIKCASDGCVVCHKVIGNQKKCCNQKKWINGGGSNGCQLNQFRNVIGNNAVVEIDAGKTYRCSGQVICNQVRKVMRNGVSGMTEYEFIPVKSGGAETAAAAAWCVGGRSSVGGMIGLRGGEGSCVTAITGNEQGCTIDLSLKL